MGKRRQETADATIGDVASAAGVSVATVSRALRGLPNVSADTRARVSEAAQRLRYQADPHASRLAAGRTNTIGMAVPLLDRWFFGKVVAGVESVLTRRGYDLILYEVDGEAAFRRFLSDSAPYRKRTDGLIIADLAIPRDLLRSLVRANVALATLGDVTEYYPSVTIDNERAARIVMDHLLALGHRSIGLIGGQPDAPIHLDVPDLRMRGALATLEEGGIALGPGHLQSGSFTVFGGYRAMIRMLDAGDPPTGVFAFSDEMAIGAMRAARERGLRIPEDVSIVGFDDHDVAWALDLTTVTQPVFGLGEAVAQLILDRLADPDARPRHLSTAVTLQARGSTAPAPPAGRKLAPSASRPA